jgi:hypothetical protein
MRTFGSNETLAPAFTKAFKVLMISARKPSFAKQGTAHNVEIGRSADFRHIRRQGHCRRGIANVVDELPGTIAPVGYERDAGGNTIDLVHKTAINTILFQSIQQTLAEIIVANATDDSGLMP